MAHFFDVVHQQHFAPTANRSVGFEVRAFLIDGFEKGELKGQGQALRIGLFGQIRHVVSHVRQRRGFVDRDQLHAIGQFDLGAAHVDVGRQVAEHRPPLPSGCLNAAFVRQHRANLVARHAVQPPGDVFGLGFSLGSKEQHDAQKQGTFPETAWQHGEEVLGVNVQRSKRREEPHPARFMARKRPCRSPRSTRRTTQAHPQRWCWPWTAGRRGFLG